MPKICYTPHRFGSRLRDRIALVNEILENYADQGYDLTIRQLHYQLVTRNEIRNMQNEYDNLVSLGNEARLAGEIDWEHIVDRTRNVRRNPHWESATAMLRDTCVPQFALDKWADQDNYVEVWIEKNALVGILEAACEPLDVPYFACVGYNSQSEQWRAAYHRLRLKHYEGKQLHILHLGDHDPSGLDMSRDIQDRLNLFLRHDGVFPDVQVHRIGLNMDQVRQYNPPPNFAKETDCRYAAYVREYGPQCWELDALSPAVLNALVTSEVLKLRDEEQWSKSISREEEAREELRDAAAWLRRQADES